MTPHRQRRRNPKTGELETVGSLKLEWQRARIGRIALATGWRDDARGGDRLARLKVLLDDLYLEGKDDVLLALKGRAFTVRDLWLASKEGKLSRLPTLTTVLPLKATIAAWAAKTANAHTRASRESTLAAITALDATASLQDLPRLVLQLRDDCEADGRASWWNHARTNALSLTRDTLGRKHAVYEALSELAPLPETLKVRKQPLTPDEARHVAAQCGPMGSAFWAMCCTGMGPGELWGSWSEEAPGVLYIGGTKTAHRKRRVPLVVAIAAPAGTIALLRYYLNKATPRVTPYDARRTFANWMELAGIPRTRRRLYLGHANQDMTDRYEWTDVRKYLAEDRATLRAFLGETAGPALRIAT